MNERKREKGKLIVLEGIDGSGKSTQFSLLTERLQKEDIGFRRAVFPRYNESSSALLKSYLAGDFGKDPNAVSAYAASTFFFVDRFASFKTDWGCYYKDGGLVVCDRYTTSNAIHQGAKLPESKLDEYLDWLYDFEFRLMELPKPDLVLYMDIDLETSLSQLRSRQEKTNTAGDIHEAHTGYLKSCLRAGRAAAERLGWTLVPCMDGKKMRPLRDIHEDIFAAVKGVIS